MQGQSKEPLHSNKPTMMQRYIASMRLAAVGDSIGYRNGRWEFCFNGEDIHRELDILTKGKGISALHVNSTDFMYSDDTVMHIATAEGLLNSNPQDSTNAICTKVAERYKDCMRKMGGRAAGMTCIRSAKILRHDGSNWKDIGFAENGGGCGASMRAACIGLYFHDNMDKLIEISIETGRTTHHNPLGYLGSLVAALFTAFAVKGIQPQNWLHLFLTIYLPMAKDYVGKNRQAQKNLGKDWIFFEERWHQYAKYREMSVNDPSQPVFPSNYGIKEREEAYHSFSINGWAGALGLDSVVVAYDALLSSLDYCKKCKQEGVESNLWEEVCLRGMLHGGDSDSTGTIVGAWYGALYGFEQVYSQNYLFSEGRQYIQKLGKQIYERTHPIQAEIPSEPEIQHEPKIQHETNLPQVAEHHQQEELPQDAQ